MCPTGLPIRTLLRARPSAHGEGGCYRSDMTEQLSTEGVRLDLTRALGHPPHPAVWEYVLDKSYVGDVNIEVQSGVPRDRAIGALAERCRGLERFATAMADRPSRPPSETRVGPDRRGRALARILAADASRLPEVRAF